MMQRMTRQSSFSSFFIVWHTNWRGLTCKVNGVPLAARPSACKARFDWEVSRHALIALTHSKCKYQKQRPENYTEIKHEPQAHWLCNRRCGFGRVVIDADLLANGITVQFFLGGFCSWGTDGILKANRGSYSSWPLREGRFDIRTVPSLGVAVYFCATHCGLCSWPRRML
jgi:hypothetical protein